MFFPPVPDLVIEGGLLVVFGIAAGTFGTVTRSLRLRRDALSATAHVAGTRSGRFMNQPCTYVTLAWEGPASTDLQGETPLLSAAAREAVATGGEVPILYLPPGPGARLDAVRFELAAAPGDYRFTIGLWALAAIGLVVGGPLLIAGLLQMAR